MLETLAHAGISKLPTTQTYVVADVPDDVSIERLDELSLPLGWSADNLSVTQQFGDDWLRSQRSAILLVPSVVARLETNAIVNPAHPQAALLHVSRPADVVWDRRLFGGGKSGLA